MWTEAANFSTPQETQQPRLNADRRRRPPPPHTSPRLSTVFIKQPLDLLPLSIQQPSNNSNIISLSSPASVPSRTDSQSTHHESHAARGASQNACSSWCCSLSVRATTAAAAHQQMLCEQNEATVTPRSCRQAAAGVNGWFTYYSIILACLQLHAGLFQSGRPALRAHAATAAADAAAWTLLNLFLLLHAHLMHRLSAEAACRLLLASGRLATPRRNAS